MNVICMSLSQFDSFQSRFVTYLLNFPRTYAWECMGTQKEEERENRNKYIIFFNKKTYPATCKYHSILTQVLALFHSPTYSVTQVFPFYTFQQIVNSHTGKTLPGISQHGTPTAVKWVMTTKGAQLTNHAHTHHRHTCPGVQGHHIYSTIVYTRLMCNALYTTDLITHYQQQSPVTDIVKLMMASQQAETCCFIYTRAITQLINLVVF